MPVPRMLRGPGRFAAEMLVVCIALAVAYSTVALEILVPQLSPEWKPVEEPHVFFQVYFDQFLRLLLPLLILRVVFFWMFGLFRPVERYAGLREVSRVALAVFSVTLVLLLFDGYLTLANPDLPYWPAKPGAGQTGTLRIPFRVPFLEGILTFFGITLIRFYKRLGVAVGLLGRPVGRTLVIIGGMEPRTDRILREIVFSPDSPYRPVAVIDPEAKGGKTHFWSRLHGVPVVRGLHALRDVLAKHEVDEILIALSRPKPADLRHIVDECEKAEVVFKQLPPSATELPEGRVAISDLRPVQIDDLLGRPAVQLGLSDAQNYLKDECVLITGAGGSIGAELCRQIRRYGPRRMILVGRGENSIYEIASELGYRFDDGAIEMVVADVRDEPRMTRLFERYRPTVIYHAAAHKHVPIMELHPEEAVTNNIFGTESVARLADRVGVKIFILISTDKAVRPTNVMGASKRVAEMVVQDIGRTSTTRFLTVRFGNVLGSRGSVVPLFQRQIERGGPVTVTHAEATRYCMTIPEAVTLVIQTGALREQGALFLLDMGRPVKVLDLARELITLAGLKPDVDIPIKIVGLRPGEKLNEELLTSGEGVRKTEVGKVFVTQPETVDPALLHAQLDVLRRAVAEGDTGAIITALQRLVPDFAVAAAEPPTGGGGQEEQVTSDE